MVRTEPTADDSFAAIFERSKFGMAMAAMIRMIATTISNSIREKPFCFFMMLDLLGGMLWCQSTPLCGKLGTNLKAEGHFASLFSYLIDNRYYSEGQSINPRDLVFQEIRNVSQN